MTNRRNFLRASALGAGALAITDRLHAGSTPGPANSSPLALGVAGYTFHNHSLDEALAWMKRLSVNAFSIKDFHLPLDADKAKITEVKNKCAAAGVVIYAAGVIYMKSAAEVDKAFAFAERAEISLIIGVPNYDLLTYTEQKVRSSGIRVAIHNHGPEDKLYPGPKDVYERIRGLDPRIGMCLDIGHSLRAGTDPVQAVADYAPRLMDLHIKDLHDAGPQARGVDLGLGVINIPALVSALYKIGFSGHCSIEYEVDTDDPLPGLAESVGYFRGVAKALR